MSQTPLFNITWKTPLEFQPHEKYLYQNGKLFDQGKYKECADCVSLNSQNFDEVVNVPAGELCYVDHIQTLDLSVFDNVLNAETNRRFYTYFLIKCNDHPFENRNISLRLFRPADNVRSEPSMADLKRHLEGMIH